MDVSAEKVLLLSYGIATDKALLSLEKFRYFFLFLHENICCGYSLEAPRHF